MVKVFFDTNFLLDLVKFKINIEEISSILEEPFSLFILSSNIKELEKIAKGKSKAGELAKIALTLIQSKNITVVKTREKNPDKAFLALATKDMIIATDDAELRKKLKKLGIRTIYVMSKKHLAIG